MKKGTIDGDAEIGYAHDQESSGVCKSWPGFADLMRLFPPCIVGEMAME